MQLIINPSQTEWKLLAQRPTFDLSSLYATVQPILDQVREKGDEAVKEYAKIFDKATLSDLTVSSKEIDEAEAMIPEELKKAIYQAKENIQSFHAAQHFEEIKTTTSPGVTCWQKSVAIEKVGLYIPGGSAPLFSTVLMLAIPAQIAGCEEIILCSPPGENGQIHPAILYAARVAGVSRIFKIGGAQAIAAMAYGTETVPKVYKIFGPGNQYVTAAKQLVSLRDVAIDMPAGPSEVLIIADKYANPAFVTADLLSQAEHGADSQAILVTTSEDLALSVHQMIKEKLTVLTRKNLAKQALEHSRILVFNNIDEAISFSNLYAPEHLIIQTNDYPLLTEQIKNAGSVFLGPYTPESAGDYASGTNHTLPTNGYARAYSGVNLDSFCKKITFQEITAKGIQHLGPTIEVMASHELLEAHKNAVTIRLKSL